MRKLSDETGEMLFDHCLGLRLRAVDPDVTTKPKMASPYCKLAVVRDEYSPFVVGIDRDIIIRGSAWQRGAPTFVSGSADRDADLDRDIVVKNEPHLPGHRQ